MAEESKSAEESTENNAWTSTRVRPGDLKSPEDLLKELDEPSKTYDKQIAERFCGLLASGFSVRQATLVKGTPSRSTVYNWLRTHPEFRTMYDIAKQDAVEAMIDETIDIADDGSNDWTIDRRGNVILDREHFERSRLRIQTRQWNAARLKAGKYGDRLQVDQETTVTKKFEELNDDELDSAIAALQARKDKATGA